MSLVPAVSAKTLAQAKSVWNETIEQYGRWITLTDMDGKLDKQVKAFCKRPKILGLWDRTQASYDQDKYMVMVKVDDFPDDIKPEKFFRATWEGEDHAFLSITEIELMGVVFGYRILVKG